MTYRLGAGRRSINQGADQKRPKNSRFHLSSLIANVFFTDD
jgi:hypothetical protein